MDEIMNISSDLNTSFVQIRTVHISHLTGIFNKTNEETAVNSEIKFILDILLLLFLITIMLPMGCEIAWTQVLAHVKKPIGIGIGMFSQFIIMPLSAYSLIKSINLTALYATGVIIISCCPGGPLSSAFSYFCDGDLSLSVAMTSLSTLLAMGIMPLNLWIYGRSFEKDNLVMPYDKLALSLVSVTSPVIVGMLIRWKAPKLATLITKIGSYIGAFLVIACMVLEVLVFPNMFTDVPGKLYGAVLALPLIGITLGFLLATIFRQTVAVRKTIAMECGIQNVPTALTVISLSFDVELQEDIILLPWLYFFAMVSGSTVICVTYHVYKKLAIRKMEKIVREENEIRVAMDVSDATIPLSQCEKTKEALFEPL